ncbi:MAG TPA: acetyl-CoA carboxylase carboxyltransferase subunit beta [Clostridiales bacterium]|nr:acetyl-CoA carboxylase carboxyltransferase subunit beta [Clostridiales bacterium]
MKMNPFKAKQYATSKVYHTRPQEIGQQEEERPNIPEGIMTKCPKCGKAIYTKLLLANLKCCNECGHHFKASAKERFGMLLDDGELFEYDATCTTVNPLNFPGYEEKLAKTQAKTGLVDGIVTGKGKIEGQPAMVGVMDPAFFMGSMGTAIGEKLTRMFERATKEGLPVIVFTASGGARMQEGIFSLMQMAKVSAAVAKHSEAGLLYITVLTDPTTGGVTASFAMLGDIILAEPGALIGFAGPRVIEQTIGQKLPEGFQRAEFLLEHGFADQIVPRDQLKQTLGTILKLHQTAGGKKLQEEEEKSFQKEEAKSPKRGEAESFQMEEGKYSEKPKEKSSRDMEGKSSEKKVN